MTGIGRGPRMHHSAGKTSRVVLEGLRGEGSIAEFCRRQRIAASHYHSRRKAFHAAGKKRWRASIVCFGLAPDLRRAWREGPARAEASGSCAIPLSPAGSAVC
ncbi:hypothetical protein [Acidimangrovimonas pyrenivorans]|uniref:Transposase n=1 Tax=Acidimangrovimonas pyrenivorans TaxID=2030798 RepID=A0ABV7AFV5_9RHOB